MEATVGPLSPLALLQTWKVHLCMGSSDRVSMYVITAHGRTVYLQRPHHGEVPCGLLLRRGTVSLRELDEWRKDVSLRSLASAAVNCDLYISVQPEFLA